MRADASVQANQANRLALIRRLYLYLVVAISLGVILGAVDNLVRVLADVLVPLGDQISVGSSDYLRDAIARGAGTLLVATPLFVVHWYFVGRLLDSGQERASAVRKLAYYAIGAYALVLAAVHLYGLLFQAVGLILGSEESFGLTSSDGQSRYALMMAVISGGLAWGLLRHLAADGDAGREPGRAGTVRRLFQTALGLAGLAMILGGGALVLQAPLRYLLEQLDFNKWSVGSPIWSEMLRGGIPTLLVGLLVWRLNWQAWQQLIRGNGGEGATALRRFYLYAATLLSAGVAVTPAALLLSDILRRLLGYPSGAALAELSIPLSLIVMGVVAWRWHWGQVQAEAARYGDTPESANVRRLYYYLVAAIGLVLLWIGLVELLRLLLDWLAVGGGLDEFRADQAANGLSLLAVGAPVWVIHWRIVQRAAEGDEATARAERRSGPRRAYLYGVALAGALLILFDLGSVIYRLILGLLGEWTGGTPIFDVLARSGTGAIFWALHLLAIRTDNRLAGDEEEPEPQPTARRQALEARIAELESALAAAKAELAALDEG